MLIKGAKANEELLGYLFRYQAEEEDNVSNPITNLNEDEHLKAFDLLSG